MQNFGQLCIKLWATSYTVKLWPALNKTVAKFAQNCMWPTLQNNCSTIIVKTVAKASVNSSSEGADSEARL